MVGGRMDLSGEGHRLWPAGHREPGGLVQRRTRFSKQTGIAEAAAL